jgi:hypothetical protein
MDEEQVTGLAAILNELKTERAQAAVERRSLTAYADIAAAQFDEARERSREAPRAELERGAGGGAKALRQIHALLGPEQRSRFAYLLRTGALTI